MLNIRYIIPVMIMFIIKMSYERHKLELWCKNDAALGGYIIFPAEFWKTKISKWNSHKTVVVLHSKLNLLVFNV